MDSPDPAMDSFRRLCDELVAPKVADFGFGVLGNRSEYIRGGLWERTVIFRRVQPGADPLYLLVQRVTILCHDSRDIEWVQVVLGEGNHEGPEAGFNSVSIWDVMESKAGCVDTNGCVIREGNSVGEALSFAMRELFQHAAEFLAGELTSFRGVRSDQNKEPRAYEGVTGYDVRSGGQAAG